MKHLGFAMAPLTLVFASPAIAVPYHFVVTGGYAADFVLDSSPTPTLAADGIGFEIDNVTGRFQDIAGAANLTFYNAFDFGGLQVTDSTTLLDRLLTENPQLYYGSEAIPAFRTGIFTLAPSFDGSLATLTITSLASSVPEMQTWAMLVAGLGMIGVALRRRRTAVKVGFA